MHTSPTAIDVAAMLVKITHLDNDSLHRALDKAAPRLTSQPWRIDTLLHIVSVSRPNEVHSCDETSCTCPTTRGWCWHRAAFLLLTTIAGAGGVVAPALLLPDMAALDEANSFDDYGTFLDQSYDWSVSV
jgi:hypothetical protein